MLMTLSEQARVAVSGRGRENDAESEARMQQTVADGEQRYRDSVMAEENDNERD